MASPFHTSADRLGHLRARLTGFKGTLAGKISLQAKSPAFVPSSSREIVNQGLLFNWRTMHLRRAVEHGENPALSHAERLKLMTAISKAFFDAQVADAPEDTEGTEDTEDAEVTEDTEVCDEGTKTPATLTVDNTTKDLTTMYPFPSYTISTRRRPQRLSGSTRKSSISSVAGSDTTAYEYGHESDDVDQLSFSSSATDLSALDETPPSKPVCMSSLQRDLSFVDDAALFEDADEGGEHEHGFGIDRLAGISTGTSTSSSLLSIPSSTHTGTTHHVDDFVGSLYHQNQRPAKASSGRRTSASTRARYQIRTSARPA
ncbi:hypothetical protein CF328_g5335 [Tilletia controversa]|nr:hypothetical protein CF328_g5335 [Tilletia controversa]